MRKSNLYFVMIFVFVLCLGNSAQAIENVIVSNVIPVKMKPYTEIIYTDNSHYKILKGGIACQSNKNDSLQETSEDKDINVEADRIEQYAKPEKGMRVVYGSDGLVTDILNQNGNDLEGNEILSKKSLTKSSLNNIQLFSASKSSTKKKKIASWGSSNNRLYRQGKEIIGYGRATTYNDKIGQRDNKLKKGDVATKLKYDNCKYGTKVKVTAKKKGSNKKITKTMYKRDVGGMPNAIVDIWKTGVEYWGYKYSSNLSLSGEVKIVHADN